MNIYIYICCVHINYMIHKYMHTCIGKCIYSRIELFFWNTRRLFFSIEHQRTWYKSIIRPPLTTFPYLGCKVIVLRKTEKPIFWVNLNNVIQTALLEWYNFILCSYKFYFLLRWIFFSMNADFLILKEYYAKN